MNGSTRESRTGVSVGILGVPAILVFALLLLAMSSCGPFSSPGTPPNQRFGHVLEAVELSWDASPGAHSYTVYFGDGDCRLESGRPENCVELESGIEGTFYLHHNYREETGNYWVIACNRFRCSKVDTVNPALPLPPPPAEIDFLQEDSVLRIAWSPVPGATHYKVYHNQDNARCTPSVSYHPQCAEVAGNVDGTVYAHTIPAPRGPYRVEVVDRTLDSLTIYWSGSDYRHHYWVAACTNLGCSAINTDYTPAEHVASYETLPQYYLIYRQPEGQAAQEIRYTPTGSSPNHTQYVDRGLQPSAIYYYRVNACNDSGCYAGSGQAGGLTEAQGPVDPPTAPTGFHAEKVDVSGLPDDARVFWEAVAGATYYEVWQGADPSQPFTFDMEISAPMLPTCPGVEGSGRGCYYDPHPNTDLDGFDTTSYRVRACNKAGCSPFTETITLR